MNRRGFFRQLIPPAPRQRVANVSHPIPSLVPWTPSDDNPWDRNAVLHFYNRVGFGISWSGTDAALSSTPADLLDAAFDDYLVSDAGMPAYPDEWKEWLFTAPYAGNDITGYQEQEGHYQTGKENIRLWWITLMSDPSLFVREKLAYVWSNHFVTEMQHCYYPKHVYRYLDCLRRNAWGNLKQFIKDMTIEPAMLLYLDGENSTSDSLNENFAREVMELMLMGRVDRYGNPNYTQDDVRSVASAVCGWRFWIEAPPPDIVHNYFAEYYFDFTKKTTPFGAEPKVYGLLAANEKGLFTYLDIAIEADIFDVMFDYRGAQIAWHIAESVYKVYVAVDTSADESQSVIEGLAQILQDSNWELKPMLQTLFLSEHFFDPTFRGAIIKSPFDYMLGLIRSLDLRLSRSQAGVIDWHGVDVSQWLLNPPNVKGWIGGRDWLNSATLPKRNLSFASTLVLKGELGGGYIDGETGFWFDMFGWADAAVGDWAYQFPGYTNSLDEFMVSLSSLFLSIPITTSDADKMLARIGVASKEEWRSLDDPSRIALVRKIVNQFFLLPQYQLS